MIFLRRKWAQKPRQWGPPSAVRAAVRDWFDRRGMACPESYIPFWENAAEPSGIIGPHPVRQYGAAKWSGGGLLAETNGTAANDVFSLNFGLDQATDWSLFLRLEKKFARSSISTIFQNTASSYSIDKNVSFRVETDNYLDAKFQQDGGHGIQALDTIANPVGDALTICVSASMDDGGTGFFFANGEYFAGTKVGTGWLNSSQGLSSDILFGAVKSGWYNYYGCDGIYGLFCAVRQALTVDQIAALHADPYGAIQPRSFPLYFFGKSVSTGFVPAWAANATVTIPPIGAGHV